MFLCVWVYSVFCVCVYIGEVGDCVTGWLRRTFKELFMPLKHATLFLTILPLPLCFYFPNYPPLPSFRHKVKIPRSYRMTRSICLLTFRCRIIASGGKPWRGKSKNVTTPLNQNHIANFLCFQDY